MAGQGRGWKVFADGDEGDDIPLWRALAQFTQSDLDDGLKQNAAVIKAVRRPFDLYYTAAFWASLFAGIAAFISLSALTLSMHSKSANSFYSWTLISLAAVAAPHVWRQFYQYGLLTPDEPLALPHEPNQNFDEFLALLQKVDGPEAYFRRGLRAKPKSLNRRQFFGRLRYFLLSEHIADRCMVLGYRAGFALPADIFLNRDDVEKIVADKKERDRKDAASPAKPKSTGTTSKYPYEDAIVSILASDDVWQINLADQDTALAAIRKMIVDQFKANPDPSGSIPRVDYPRVKECAEKIHRILKNPARR